MSDIFTELGFDKTQPIREQEPNPLPDRKESDDIVFDDGANRSRAKRGVLGNGRISQATIG